MKTKKHGNPRPQGTATAERVGIGQWKAFRIGDDVQVCRPPLEAGEFLSDEETVMETATVSAVYQDRGRQAEHQLGRPMLDGPLLTTKEAADYLRISIRQVQYLSGRGELTCVEICNSIRYTTADLREFVARHRRRRGQV